MAAELNAEDYFNKAEGLREQGKFGEAFDAYIYALRLNPRNLTTQRLLEMCNSVLPIQMGIKITAKATVRPTLRTRLRRVVDRTFSVTPQHAKAYEPPIAALPPLPRSFNSGSGSGSRSSVRSTLTHDSVTGLELTKLGKNLVKSIDARVGIKLDKLERIMSTLSILNKETADTLLAKFEQFAAAVSAQASGGTAIAIRYVRGSLHFGPGVSVDCPTPRPTPKGTVSSAPRRIPPALTPFLETISAEDEEEGEGEDIAKPKSGAGDRRASL